MDEIETYIRPQPHKLDKIHLNPTPEITLPAEIDLKLKELAPQEQELKPPGQTTGTEKHILSRAERESINRKMQHSDANDSIQLWIPKTLKQKIKIAAESECRTMNNYIYYILLEHIREWEKSEAARRGD